MSGWRRRALLPRLRSRSRTLLPLRSGALLTLHRCWRNLLPALLLCLRGHFTPCIP